jgi:ATP-dependent DNA helicase RecG
VFGIQDKTKKKIGTNIRFSKIRKGAENFENWINRMMEPKIHLDLIDFECDGLNFSIAAIEPTYDRPVKFSGVEYIRIGENKKKLLEFPEHERALWLATGRRKFEDAIASANQTPDQVLERLDAKTFYELANEPEPKRKAEILKKFVAKGFVNDNLDGHYDITNLGAILLAQDISDFPSLKGKAVRVIKYVGKDKSKSDFEREATKGYAGGFVNLMRFLMKALPFEETYIEGVRKNIPIYPETAIRELIANALIHQDFTVAGAGPVIEVYSNRIEISNPGNSLIETDRMLDERRSRNETLASTMRGFGLCEERGGGLDKTMIAVEQQHLPAPEFVSSKNSMRVILFGPKKFAEMSKQEKQRSCFYHCVLRWINHDPMGNASLRERFSVLDADYQAVSSVISEAIKSGRIVPADPQQGRRNAKYVPYWAGE